jgi:HSP20 family protein
VANITRWNPFDDLVSFWPREWLTRFDPSGGSVRWSPRCDVDETDTEIAVHAELPGVLAEDMEVRVHAGVLTIRGEKRTERKEAGGEKGYTERFFGSFERTLSIPGTVDESSITAALKDGVLEVRLPKTKPEPPAVRTIEVKAG